MRYGIEAFRIVAYTFDAAYYCIHHAELRHGKQEGKDWVRENAVDSEGNPVHPVFSSDHDGSNQVSCGDNIQEIICLICGATEEYRKYGDPCWNCNSAWYTDDPDDITGLTVHDHPNWSHEAAYGPCTK